jgi:hypothetical protein
MGQLSIVIDDELDARFRAVIAKTIGFKKGNIKIAIEQAIQLWIDDQKV